MAYARRLGYRSNVPAQWESGRRVPPMAAVAHAAQIAGIDWIDVFRRFHPQTAEVLATEGLAAWLSSHKGRASHASIARSCTLSAHQVGRMVRGDTDPRLHEFLELVQALTGRAADWVAALVPIQEVPSLAHHETRGAASALMYDRPWAAAVLVTLGVQQPDPHPAPRIARALGLEAIEVQQLLERLIDVGLVERTARGLRVREAVSLDTPPTAAQVQGMRAHWGRVASERLTQPRDGDRYHYTVCNVSHADLDRIQEVMATAYREVRSIVASSEEPEVSALVSAHVMAWGTT